MWALSNTQSLNTASPSLSLNSSFIGVNIYGRPPRADQQAGDIPLGSCINDTTTVISSLGGFTGCWMVLCLAAAPAHTQAESRHVDSGDSRMMQVVFANEKLLGGPSSPLFVRGVSTTALSV